MGLFKLNNKPYYNKIMRGQSRSNRRDKKKKQKSSYQEKTHFSEIKDIHARTANQQRMMDCISDYNITLVSGAAGTGKSLIAFYKGIKLLDKGLVDQILYIKPIVDFQKSKGLGFLPGTIDEKLEPLLTSVHDSLDVFLSKGKKDILLKKSQIQFQPLEYIRGRSLRDKYIVLDESQNTNPHAILTVISRLEESSKLVVLGDPMQSDIRHERLDGLSDAIDRLSGMSEVGIVQFTHNDIQRAGFLKDVIRRYQK